MTKRIPLTQGKYALVDDADYAWLIQWKWRYASSGYAIRHIENNGKRKYIWMHREIMAARPGQLVDHIDTNRLNDTRANLRFVNHHQNMWNRSPNHNSRSPYKGISHHRKGWHAKIRFMNQRIHLGYFDTPEEAARMYDAAAYHFFGTEYARVNFPDVPVSACTQVQLETILGRKDLVAV